MLDFDTTHAVDLYVFRCDIHFTLAFSCLLQTILAARVVLECDERFADLATLFTCQLLLDVFLRDPNHVFDAADLVFSENGAFPEDVLTLPGCVRLELLKGVETVVEALV